MNRIEQSAEHTLCPGVDSIVLFVQNLYVSLLYTSPTIALEYSGTLD